MAPTDAPTPEPITADEFRTRLGNMTYDTCPSNGWRARIFEELVSAYAAALARAEAAEARASELERERDALIRHRIIATSNGRFRVNGLHGISGDRWYATKDEAVQDIRECAGLNVLPREDATR